MGLFHSPKIVTNGLQFVYDDDNSAKSGQTTDLISGATITQVSTNYATIPTNAGNLSKVHMTGAVGGSTAPAGSTGATVFIWNKRTSTTTGTWDRICEFKFGAGAAQRTWWIGYYTNVTDRIHCSTTYYPTNGSSSGAAYSSIDPTWANAGLTHVVGQYYGLTFTYNNASRSRKFYINANLGASGDRPGFGDLMNPDGGDMFIGGTRDTAYANHITKMVMIYDRELSASEVSDVFHSTKTRFGY